jgi:hypothetical protein
MEKRVFNRKKLKVWKFMLPFILSGIVGYIVLTVLVKGLIYLKLPGIYEKMSWSITALILIPIYSVMLSYQGLKLFRSKARVEIDGEIVSEFDQSAKLIARGTLSHVMAIEQVRVSKSEALIVRFANDNFAVIGEGWENAKELSDFVISCSGVTPTLVGKVSMVELGKEILSRKPIDPDQMYSPYPR